MAALLAQLEQLHQDLAALMERDPEQEVVGSAFPLLDAVLSEAREALPTDSTLRSQVADLADEAIVTGERVRAADALVIVGQLLAALRHYTEAPPKEISTLAPPLGHLAVLDHLSPIHRSSRVEEPGHLFVAAGLGATQNDGGRSLTALGRDFRSAFESVLLSSKLHMHLSSPTSSRSSVASGSWELARPTNTSMVTLELGGDPYEGQSEIAAQAAFSRYSHFAPGIATLAVHVGLSPLDGVAPFLSLTGLFWLLDAVIETAAMTEIPALFEQAGVAGSVFGPALFIGDGRSDIAGLVDCSGLARMPEAPHFSFGASYSDRADDLRDWDSRRAFINDAIGRLLIDGGFPDAEELVNRLPE
jgi:hypothetical protein